ncbi:MAG TPA: hypothetical protein VE981_24655 [Planctomycetota bacterium]|nr:hypothetical protein [Planctomycetota bacterium]
MWKVEYRQMTPDEREVLQNLLGACSSSGDRGIGAVAGALPVLAAALATTSSPAVLLGAVLLGAIAGSAAARMLRDRRVSELRQALGRDLRNGKVQVFQVAPRDVVRLTGPGGSVAGYFAGIGDGHVMFIEPREWEYSGGGVGEPGFERLFPCSRFSLARAPRSKVDLGFTCHGERIAPVRDIPVASETLLNGWFEDGDVFWADLNMLERRLNSCGR